MPKRPPSPATVRAHADIATSPLPRKPSLRWQICRLRRQAPIRRSCAAPRAGAIRPARRATPPPATHKPPTNPARPTDHRQTVARRAMPSGRPWKPDPPGHGRSSSRLDTISGFAVEEDCDVDLNCLRAASDDMHLRPEKHMKATVKATCIDGQLSGTKMVAIPSARVPILKFTCRSIRGRRFLSTCASIISTAAAPAIAASRFRAAPAHWQC